MEVIQTVRQVIYQEPRLRGVKTEEAEAEEEQEMSEAARTERERRSAERNLYQELSRYYPRSRGLWTRTQLLMSGKHGRTQCTCDILVTYFLSSGARYGDAP